MCNNNGVIHLTKLSRTRVLHVFNILVSTGMRAGEFTAIDFNNVKINRTVESKLSGEVCVEITINTEKTKKNREVFIPKASYEFIKKYGSISYGTLAYDFRIFRE
jgi:site-specific recombinase XerD